MDRKARGGLGGLKPNKKRWKVQERRHRIKNPDIWKHPGASSHNVYFICTIQPLWQMKFEDAVKIHFGGLFLLLNFVCCWVNNGELQLRYELCLFLYLGRTITCCTAQFPSICFAHLLFLHWFVIFPGLCMQFCLSCCFSVALFDFPPHHFSFGKTHSESSGGSFFFPFTNRTHLLLFLFHVTSINITETSNRLCVWLSPLSRSLPAAQPASISVNGQRS